MVISVSNSSNLSGLILLRLVIVRAHNKIVLKDSLAKSLTFDFISSSVSWLIDYNLPSSLIMYLQFESKNYGAPFVKSTNLSWFGYL